MSISVLILDLKKWLQLAYNFLKPVHDYFMTVRVNAGNIFISYKVLKESSLFNSETKIYSRKFNS